MEVLLETGFSTMIRAEEFKGKEAVGREPPFRGRLEGVKLKNLHC
jgi:hypothetical protein